MYHLQLDTLDKDHNMDLLHSNTITTTKRTSVVWDHRFTPATILNTLL